MEPSCEINHLSFVQSLTQKLQDCEGNPIEISQKEACQLVQHLKLLAGKLAGLDKSYQQLHFHCTYGDYASELCKDLKKDSSKALQPSASDLSDKIKEEEARIRNDVEDLKVTPVLDALKERASELGTESVKVDLELAKLAINAYALRNKACHSKGRMAYWTGDNDLTASAFHDDIAEIRNCFTENEVDLARKWRSLLLYWREQNLMQNPFGSWIEVPKDTNKRKVDPENIVRQIDLPEFRELSRASKTALVEHLKRSPNEFDINLFDPKSETKFLRNTTNSAPESCYGLKRKWDQISSDQNPMLNKQIVGERVFQRAKVEGRYESLHQEVCRHQDRLSKIDQQASEKVLRSRLEELKGRCRKAIEKAGREDIAEQAKRRRAARKGGNV